MKLPSIPKYFFNVVDNGLSTVDTHGRRFGNDQEARQYAEHVAMLLADPARDQRPDRSFIAVTGEDGRLVVKVPLPRPPHV